MGPKKQEQKKGAAGQMATGPATVTISEEEFQEARKLPNINDFVFTNLYGFKMTRNQSRLKQTISKQYSFSNPEDPNYTEEKAQTYKTIDTAQVAAQAVSRGLMTADEAADPSKLDEDKWRNIQAQATVESIVAIQQPLRQKKKDKIDSAAASTSVVAQMQPDGKKGGSKDGKGSATPIQTAEDAANAEKKEGEEQEKVELVIYLKNFPQTAQDLEAMLKYGLDRFHGVFMIEEIFNREFDSDEEETDAKLSQVPSVKNPTPMTPQSDRQSPDDPKTEIVKEKLINRRKERAQQFEELVKINRIVKSQPSGSDLRNCKIERIQFEGPVNPIDLPPPPEDGQEPQPLEEEVEKEKAKQFMMYEMFSLVHKKRVDGLANQLISFREQQQNYKDNMVQLWPIVMTAEEEERRRLEQEELERQLAEKARQEEEARKAAEAAAKGPGSRKSNTKDSKQSQQQAKQQQPEVKDEETGEDDIVEVKEPPEPFLSQDDDPAKTFEFLEYKKALSEMPQGTTTVGSMLGAMIFQIGQQAEKRQLDALDDEYYESKKEVGKKMSQRLVARKSTQEMLIMNQKQQAMASVFDEAFQKISLELSLEETDYKHCFAEDGETTRQHLKSSPYMIVKSDKDKIMNESQRGVYKFSDGMAQDEIEQRTLESCIIPGVNKRLDMPEKETMNKAVRESTVKQVMSLCSLPQMQTERCLVLQAFAKMMQKNLPERTFNFLDRNFVEEIHDQNTLRQLIWSALTESRADMMTDYYEMDDGLLISVYFKNPPGRLLRRQWTAEPRVFPEFSEWSDHISDSQSASTSAESNQYYEIPVQRVGLLKNSTKYSFPSDNSVIRVDKYYAGQRRMAVSHIIKDNFMFGVCERPQSFRQKASGEDELRNIDARKLMDKTCDFWLKFDNGVRLLIEMQDGLRADVDNIPPSKLPKWLEKKLEIEERKLTATKSDEDITDRLGTIEVSERKAKTIEQQDAAPAEDLPASAIGGRSSHYSKKMVENSQTEREVQKTTLNSNDANQTMQSGKPQLSMSPKDQTEKEKTEAEVEDEAIGEDDLEEELKNDKLLFEDELDVTKGARLTFTFNEGLIVQIQPNGDLLQIQSQTEPLPKTMQKGLNFLKDQEQESEIEVKRLITSKGEIIKYMADGNFIIYYIDGTITRSDKRRGVWHTTNPRGVVRSRKIKTRIVFDDQRRLEVNKKIDPETNASLLIREDGVLQIEYPDESMLLVMPDGTNVLRKKRSDGEAGTVTYVTKKGFVPYRIVYDPVKARSRTIIGPGGTDALMGKDMLMERSNTGFITEVLLPDQTLVQTYQEKQELPGFNNFESSFIHMIRRQDYSVIKVRQDGEVVIITATQRSRLNENGNQIKEFGTKDYDYFFELFGVPSERKSGVYTANLDLGRIWMTDEEGNHFIVYANGDSVEKLSVSFNMDQMVQGIENKEPESPRMKDGEYIEDECKFLPPPNEIAHPRLFYVRSDGTGAEFFNAEQLSHMFRTYGTLKSNPDITQNSTDIVKSNEQCTSHVFIEKKPQKFNAEAFDVSKEFPKLPQTLELVNQTVSIPTEPVVDNFTYKNIIEYEAMDQDVQEEFREAVKKYEDNKKKQAKLATDLVVQEPAIIIEAHPPRDERSSKFSKLNATSKLSVDVTQKSGRSTSMQEENVGTNDVSLGIEKQQELPQESTEIDDTTGLQMYSNPISLNFMEKFQMRIIKERGLDLDSLLGDEYQKLKDYKKLEQRRERLNNMTDYFEPGNASIDPFAGDDDKENFNTANFVAAGRSIQEQQLMTPDSPANASRNKEPRAPFKDVSLEA